MWSSGEYVCWELYGTRERALGQQIDSDQSHGCLLTEKPMMGLDGGCEKPSGTANAIYSKYESLREKDSWPKKLGLYRLAA